MRRKRDQLRGKTFEEIAEWAKGRPLSEVIEVLVEVPSGQTVMVTMVPKNGTFNRCSVCRTAITPTNAMSRPMEVRTPKRTLHAMVIVCSESCWRRLE